MKRIIVLALAALLLVSARAEAAIAYVQTAIADSTAGTATTASITMTGGNAIIVALDNYYSTSAYVFSHTCSDGTNSYTKVFDKSDFANGGSSEVWVALNITGGSRTVSCSQSSSGQVTIRVMEFSGIKTSSAFDVSSGQEAGSTSFTSGTTSTTAQANELLIGSIAVTNGNHSGGAGWTDLGQYSAASGVNMQTSYKIVSATGTYAYTGTTDTTISRVLIATFKDVNPSGGGGGGAATPPGRLLLGVGR